MIAWSVDDRAQRAFVELSGDRNPLHTDPLAARRLPFGRVTVHGVHLLLHALDLISHESGASPRRIRCTFRRPVGIGDELTTDVSIEADVARATVSAGATTAADITVDLGPSIGALHLVPGTRCNAPEVHTLESLAGLSGRIDVGQPDTSDYAALPPAVVADLLAVSRLVGMHVPGLHSMFSSLDLTAGNRSDDGHLAFRVTAVDERFSRVTIDVAGGTLRGTITAFVRPQPVEPELGAARPPADEFAGQRWLVVGGSRGLGAVAVLLLAAGGADVRFTYHRGEQDASRLATRTRGALALRFDVDGSIIESLGDWRPTHLVYMASPPIFVGAADEYSAALFEQFRHVYVDRFVALVDELLPHLHGVLWPSSIAVDQPSPGTAEYADAKRAGELACADLARVRPELRVAVPRLPRLLTDQTTSYVPVEFGDTAGEVLAALRAVAPARDR